MDSSRDREYSKRRRRDSPDKGKDYVSQHQRRNSRDSPERGKDYASQHHRRDSPDKSKDSTSQHRRQESPVKRKDATAQQNEKPNAQKAERVKKKTEDDPLLTRTGGAYIPPARLKLMQAEISDKNSVQYQRISWEALKKSIHGLINKINTSNIGVIVRELFKENVVRGRGLLARSIMQAQSFSPTFSHVYAALVGVINSKFPQTGELMLRRLVIQFRRGFRRNDKEVCLTSTRFIAHLVNQQVAHEVVALEILTLLLESPSEDSVEVAVGFLKECGMKLSEVTPKGVHAVFERLRSVLHEGQLDKRVQYMIEVMFAVRKDGFKDFAAVIGELDLVEEEEQFTHLITLDEATNPDDMLNVFKLDPEFEENEEKYKSIQKAILDEGSSGSEESGSESDDEDEDSPEKEDNNEIIDNTETNLVALRRTIYLTIQSSLDFEECAHKLLKLELKPGHIVELCHMVLDCCAQQRTYEKFYGLLAQRFCQLNKIYLEPFQEIFKTAYDTIHRFETNKLRNVAKFFAHLLYTDAIPWLVLSSIRLNEDDTTSSSRIFIKILFQELCEYMSLPKLNDRVKDPTLQEAFDGLFPRDNLRNTRFAINFFTSIGLGGLTDDLREHLKTVPKVAPPNVLPPPAIAANQDPGKEPSSSDQDDDSLSEDSDSSEEEQQKKKKKEKSKRAKSKKSKHKKQDKKKAKKEKQAVKAGSNQEHIQRLRSEIQHLEKEQAKLSKEKEQRRILQEAEKNNLDSNWEEEQEHQRKENRKRRDEVGLLEKARRDFQRFREEEEMNARRERVDQVRGRNERDEDQTMTRRERSEDNVTRKDRVDVQAMTGRKERDGDQRRGRKERDEDQARERMVRDDDSGRRRKEREEDYQRGRKESDENRGRKEEDEDHGRLRKEIDENRGRKEKKRMAVGMKLKI